MEMLSLEKELTENPYPGRGVLLGRSEEAKTAATEYLYRTETDLEQKLLTSPKWKIPHL